MEGPRPIEHNFGAYVMNGIVEGALRYVQAKAVPPNAIVEAALFSSPKAHRQGIRPAFSLVELLVVIAVVTLLAAFLFPVFSRAREAARASACLSNLKQVGTAVSLYIQDYDEVYPMGRLPDATHLMGGCQANDPTIPSGSLEGSSTNWKRATWPYIRNTAVFICPSNRYAWASDPSTAVQGDESNVHFSKAQWLPNSYAISGAFFHEAVPPCWYGEQWMRPRFLAEIERPSNLILILESRYPYPDLGNWFIPQREPGGGNGGPFQSHNAMCTWLFADQHAKRLKLATTCRNQMWTDRFVDRSNGCEGIGSIASEYR